MDHLLVGSEKREALQCCAVGPRAGNHNEIDVGPEVFLVGREAKAEMAKIGGVFMR